MEQERVRKIEQEKKRDLPIFQIYRRTIIEFQVGVIKYSFPISDSPLFESDRMSVVGNSLDDGTIGDVPCCNRLQASVSLPSSISSSASSLVEEVDSLVVLWAEPSSAWW